MVYKSFSFLQISDYTKPVRIKINSTDTFQCNPPIQNCNDIYKIQMDQLILLLFLQNF